MADADPKTAAPKSDTGSNTEKDPKDWTTGGEPMTGAQMSYLKTLCEETDTPFDDSLDKAEASILIDKLQAESDRLKKAS